MPLDPQIALEGAARHLSFTRAALPLYFLPLLTHLAGFKGYPVPATG